jgi:mRNA-degrading endonuclease RelE of RelBE toxin-antitoxin system
MYLKTIISYKKVIYLTMYTIEIKKQAKRKLLSLRPTDRLRITEAIVRLGRNSNDISLNIKR